MLLGTAGFLLTPEREASRWRLSAARALAAVAMAADGLTVTEHPSANDLGIDARPVCGSIRCARHTAIAVTCGSG